jgi:hypothetical protein
VKVNVDHPHTNPGDSRKECYLCGKWVYPFLHSCKGVPATPDAEMRFLANREEYLRRAEERDCWS